MTYSIAVAWQPWHDAAVLAGLMACTLSVGKWLDGRR